MTRTAMRQWLAGVPLFAELSPAELDALASAAQSLRVEKHARLFEQGAPADCCFALVAGSARVVLSGDGDREVTLITVKSGTLVGEIALIDHSPRTAALIAAEPSHFIRIPLAAFDELRKNPQFERRLVAHVASLVRWADDHVRGLATNPAVARVAWCLSRIARQDGTAHGTSIVIPNKPHHELAEMAGCSRETVTRALSTLRRKKCVSWSGDTMRLEVDGLQRYLGSELQLRKTPL